MLMTNYKSSAFLGWEIEMVKYNDEEYPEALRQLIDAPLLLYRMGKKLNEYGRKIAIVGTRKASESGRKNAWGFAKNCAEAGLAVVSGLAFGIDSAAHRGCLDGGGQTIAVLGSGLNNITPPGQSGLVREILAKGGSVISEYAADEPAYKGRFLERNRIIAGLCEATLVVEAPSRSGALNTATQAFEQNRQVFALPGEIDKLQSKGCHLLIKQNKAELVDEVKDILKFYNLESSAKIHNSNLSVYEKILLKLIEAEKLETMEIVSRSKLEYDEIMMALTGLEINRLIRKNLENRWEIMIN
jgi:DNA processing protein